LQHSSFSSLTSVATSSVPKEYQLAAVNSGLRSAEHLAHEADVIGSIEPGIIFGSGATVAAIDRTIDRIIELKSKLIYSRNSLTDINRLSRGILAQIFLWAIPSTLNCANSDPSKNTRKQSLNNLRSISHVCRHWRNVALSTPSLWNRCTPLNLDSLRTFLGRTGTIPLVLDISFPCNPSDDYILLLLSNLSRARELYINLGYDLDQANMSNMAVTRIFLRALQHMPAGLERLHMSTREMLCKEKVFTDLDWLPPNLKDKDCLPQLRHVFLDSVTITWNCGLFQHLRTLTLLNPVSLTLRRLSYISKACPDLEELTLYWHSVQLDEEIEKVGNGSIILSRLRLARISIDRPHIVLRLLDRIVFPAEANVWVNIHNFVVDRRTLARMVQAFADKFSHMQQPLRRLGVALNDCKAGVYGSINDSTGNVFRQDQVHPNLLLIM
jgi:hypothetical protein